MGPTNRTYVFQNFFLNKTRIIFQYYPVCEVLDSANITILTDVAVVGISFKSKFAESVALEARTGFLTLANLTTTV